jgi:hypothetical protein
MGERLPRGLRNNNPGNIEYRATEKWRGKLPHDPKIESRFERFVSLEMGARAQIINMRTWYRRGKNTIQELIQTWAPASENPTDAYIANVARQLKYDKDKEFPFTKEFVLPMAMLIAEFENGKHPLINKELYERAWKLV